MKTEVKINRIATTEGLQPCAWCSGRSKTLPLGICKLHAAAPELLEALQAIAGFWQDGGVALSPHALLSDSDTLTIHQQIRAAIAKALQTEGGE